MKRAQAWGFDLLVAVALFTVALITFYLYAINYDSGQTSTATELEKEARSIAAILLSEGSPTNWDTYSVIKPGLLTDKQLNETKIAELKAIADTDYDRTQNLLGTSKHWYLNFSQPLTINGSEVSGFGNVPSSYTELIKVERVSSFKNELVTLYIEVWE